MYDDNQNPVGVPLDHPIDLPSHPREAVSVIHGAPEPSEIPVEVEHHAIAIGHALLDHGLDLVGVPGGRRVVPVGAGGVLVQI